MMSKGFLAGYVMSALIGAVSGVGIESTFSKPGPEPLAKMIFPMRQGDANVPAFQGSSLPQSIYPGCWTGWESDCRDDFRPDNWLADNEPIAI
jgi:hypothetical protein